MTATEAFLSGFESYLGKLEKNIYKSTLLLTESPCLCLTQFDFFFLKGSMWCVT